MGGKAKPTKHTCEYVYGWRLQLCSPMTCCDQGWLLLDPQADSLAGACWDHFLTAHHLLLLLHVMCAAAEIKKKIEAATTNQGGGKAGLQDRKGGAVGHAKYMCPICKTAAPSLTSMQVGRYCSCGILDCRALLLMRGIHLLPQSESRQR